MALFQRQSRDFKNRVKGAVLRAGLALEGEMHRIVAIDTGRLDNSILTRDLREDGPEIAVSVGSRGVPYAQIVNDGVGEVYNYHRRRGASRPIVYTGDGQEYIQRSLAAKRDEMLIIIRNA